MHIWGPHWERARQRCARGPCYATRAWVIAWHWQIWFSCHSVLILQQQSCWSDGCKSNDRIKYSHDVLSCSLPAKQDRQTESAMRPRFGWVGLYCPQQDIVEFLKEAEDAIRSFHATQAGTGWSAAHINDRYSGYWIRCRINRPILTLNQQQNISYQNSIFNIFSFHKKGWLESLNMQQQNCLN